MDTRPICLDNGTIYSPTDVIPNGRVIVSRGTIQQVGPRDAIQPPAGCEIVDATSRLICPGFIDIHVHGGGGGDTMDGSADALARMTRAHASHGTTSMCITTMAATDAALDRALAAAAEFAAREPEGARILGVHLEGPFLSERRRGAHRADRLAPPSIERLQRYQDRARGVIKIMTIAPELPGALDVISYARASGIVPSIGHTSATYQQTLDAVSAGAMSGTHVYNAMEPLASREPGTVGALMTCEAIACEVIADGRHVHPAAIDVLIRAKGPSRVVLVTDCMRPFGDALLGSFELSGRRVLVREGGCFTEDGALCGTLLSMDRAQNNINRLVGHPRRDAIMMATLSPARLLGLSERKGTITPGSDADIVVCDTDMNVTLTMVGGRIVYRA